MATKTNSANGTSTKKQPTAQEMREFYEQNKRRLENFDSANDALLNLRNLSKNTTYTTISNFNKEELRSYLRNVSANEVNLRNLSRYLYYRSQVYQKLIAYNANMFCLNARSVIPEFSFVDKNDKKKTLKSYDDTLKALDKMNLQYEFSKMYVANFRDDVAFGCCYFDPDAEEKTSFFILPLPADYCKIAGVYKDGSFAPAMNMDYFKKNKDLLELWGEPFQSMAKNAEKAGESKWQIFPPEYGIALKAHAEDWETVVPVFSGLLNSLINLLDLEDIQSIKDEQEIYKMVWMELETLQGSDEPNDWKIDPSLSLPYWNRMVNEALPDYTSSSVVP